MNRTAPHLLSILTGFLALEPDTPALERLMAGGQIDWPALLQFASGHLVTPALAASIQRAGLEGHVPEEARTYLETVRTLNRDRNRMLREQFAAIAGALNRVGIQPMTLKGALALLPDQYDGAQDRVTGDLDLMISPERIDAAAQAILELGYVSRAAGPAQDAHHHIAGLEHPSLLVAVELHRRILKDVDDSALLMGAACWSETPLDTHQVLTPDPATRLLHNALHAQISDGASRTRVLQLRPLLEFAQLSRNFEAKVSADDMLSRLRQPRQNAFLEYYAQAERWLGLAYPGDMPRSRRQTRELWLTERIAVDRRWRFAADSFHALRGDGWSEIPLRLARRALRARGVGMNDRMRRHGQIRERS